MICVYITLYINLKLLKIGIDTSHNIITLDRYQSDIDQAHVDDAAVHIILDKDDSPLKNPLYPKVDCSEL